MPDLLRNATWLDDHRVIAISTILLSLIMGLTGSIPWTFPALDLGRDFAAFWTAGRLALEGQAVGAYGDPAREALTALIGSGHYPAFYYPPQALLLWGPFGAVPFGVAATAWVVATGTAYAFAVRSLTGQRWMVPIWVRPVPPLGPVTGVP